MVVTTREEEPVDAGMWRFVEAFDLQQVRGSPGSCFDTETAASSSVPSVAEEAVTRRKRKSEAA